MEIHPKQTYTVREAAELLGCTISSMYALIKRGKIETQSRLILTRHRHLIPGSALIKAASSLRNGDPL